MLLNGRILHRRMARSRNLGRRGASAERDLHDQQHHEEACLAQRRHGARRAAVRAAAAAIRLKEPFRWTRGSGLHMNLASLKQPQAMSPCSEALICGPCLGLS